MSKREEISMQELVQKLEMEKEERKRKKDETIILYATVEEFFNSPERNVLWITVQVKDELKPATESFLEAFGATWGHLDKGFQGEYAGSYSFLEMRYGKFETAIQYFNNVKIYEISSNELLKMCDFR